MASSVPASAASSGSAAHRSTSSSTHVTPRAPASRHISRPGSPACNCHDFQTLLTDGEVEDYPCEPTDYNWNYPLVPIVYVSSQCLTRVWLHEFVNWKDGGWSWCVSPFASGAVPSKYQDPFNIYISRQTRAVANSSGSAGGGSSDEGMSIAKLAKIEVLRSRGPKYSALHMQGGRLRYDKSCPLFLRRVLSIRFNRLPHHGITLQLNEVDSS